MTNESGRNEVELCGVAVSQPILSHENHGVQFYRFLLGIPRLSGQADTLPILLPSSLLAQVAPDVTLHVCGQLRSFNNKSGVGSRLVLTVYAMSIEPAAVEPMNRIILAGTLCKPPVLRRTPLGRSICDLMVAVPRRYGRADYLPVIAWGQQSAVRGGPGGSGRPGPEPAVYQSHRRRIPGAHRLRSLHDAPSEISGSGGAGPFSGVSGIVRIPAQAEFRHKPPERGGFSFGRKNWEDRALARPSQFFIIVCGRKSSRHSGDKTGTHSRRCGETAPFRPRPNPCYKRKRPPPHRNHSGHTLRIWKFRPSFSPHPVNIAVAAAASLGGAGKFRAAAYFDRQVPGTPVPGSLF